MELAPCGLLIDEVRLVRGHDRAGTLLDHVRVVDRARGLHRLEVDLEVVRDASPRGERQDRQELVQDAPDGGVPDAVDVVVVVPHVALAGGVHSCRAPAEELGDRDPRRARDVHHHAVVHIREAREGVLVLVHDVAFVDDARPEV